jgi:hypothetical protein
VKNKSKNFLLHLIVPVIGFLIIGYVLINAAPEAKIGGLVWLVLGAGVFLYYRRSGTSVELSGEGAVLGEGGDQATDGAAAEALRGTSGAAATTPNNPTDRTTHRTGKDA